jgi:DNA-directed RNA polymerase subunit K/omega
VVDENLATDTNLEDTVAPAVPFVKVPPPESRFLFVDIAALRAKQLRRGARPRITGMADGTVDGVTAMPRKPERVAMEEVRQGMVMFDIPPAAPEPTGDDQ